MTLVRFFKADGTLDKEVDAAPGQRLLDVAWAAREPLEGACEGVMACSTCHVIVEAEDFERLPPASEEEEDLLDLAAHATRTCARRIGAPLSAATIDPRRIAVPLGSSTRAVCARAGR